jgi:FlaA1/EpsC-like NDP-sugar epimerase
LQGNGFWSAVKTRLQGLSQNIKVVIMAGTDLLLLAIVVMISYMLRLSAFELPAQSKLSLYFVAPLLSVTCMFGAGIYRNVSRNFSTHNEFRLLMSQLAVPPLWALVLLGNGTVGFARSVVLIYLILSILTLVLVRRLAAVVFSEHRSIVPHRERIPVLIYGAGKEGTLLVDALNRQGRYRPVAFLDTDYTLVGRVANGLKIKSIEDLDKVVAKYAPREVMIAKPNQNRNNRRTLVEMFLDRGLQVKTVPGIDDIVDGVFDVNSLRPIKLEDLLGREPVPPVQDLMDSALKDRVVLITGAGGSIGSELVRQIIGFAPRSVVLFDSNEFALFEIHREMEASIATIKSPPKVNAVLASILDEHAVENVMKDFGVEVIFHAAAYKHVRMVQENAIAGIRNNVWGTLAVAQAAMRHKVKLLVLVSTDKAVRPTSIMGASKRVAEMVMQALARETAKDQIFAMVRFGNVLGSTGSVVPLFQEQIAIGGPVKVTHPDVTRYFMLIPEAAQLVVQAGAMAKRGEVFVLDMGEPVKIVNLAETMIELAGMKVKTASNLEGDIEIEFVGLRDGEKLFEELQIGRDVSATAHARIMRSNEFFMPWKELETALVSMQQSLNSNNLAQGLKQLMHLAQLGSEQSEINTSTNWESK